MSEILLALGANLAGQWGEPSATFARAMQEISSAGLCIRKCSSIYSTAPVGTGRQARYLNAVIAVAGSIAPGQLLRMLKAIERRAGRRLGRHWGPRVLDLDILDYGGRQVGRAGGRRERGRVILPHPEMHRRAFVLRPLSEVAPAWRHPQSGLGARSLLVRLDPRARAGVQRTLDSVALACDKTRT